MPTLALDKNGLPVLLADAPPKRPIRVQVQAPPGPWMDSSGHPYPRTESKVELSDDPAHTRMPPPTDPDLDLIAVDDVYEQTGVDPIDLLRAIGSGLVKTYNDGTNEVIRRADLEKLKDGASEAERRAAANLVETRTSSASKEELAEADRFLWGGRRPW